MTAAPPAARAAAPAGRHRFGRAVPWLLLAPGLLWLFVFYVLPAIQMFTYSISTGSIENGFTITWLARRLRRGARPQFGKQFLNSILYGGLATLLTFLIGFPVAYTIAFRGGRYKNLILFLVIAPFFTSFLIRTISWKILLGDEGPLLGPLKHTLGILPGSFQPAGTPRRAAVRADLQLPAVHDPAAVRRAREDRPAADRGGRRPVRRAAGRRSGGSPSRSRCRACSRARCSRSSRRWATTSTPSCWAIPQTRMIGNVIQNRLLVQNDYPVGLRPVVHPDGRDPRRGGDLRPRPGHRAADRLMATTSTADTAAAHAAPARRATAAGTRLDRYLLPVVHGARARATC